MSKLCKEINKTIKNENEARDLLIACCCILEQYICSQYIRDPSSFKAHYEGEALNQQELYQKLKEYLKS